MSDANSSPSAAPANQDGVAMIAEVEAQEEKVRLNFIIFKDQLLEAKRRGLLDENRYQEILAEMEAGMAEICRDVVAFRRFVLEEEPLNKVRFKRLGMAMAIDRKYHKMDEGMTALCTEFTEAATDQDDGRRPVEGDLLASLKSELKSELKAELKAEMETGMSALRKELKEVRDEKATLASDLISVRTKADRLEAEIEELRVALAASTTADADAHGE